MDGRRVRSVASVARVTQQDEEALSAARERHEALMATGG